jgi:hypothetical protein
VEWAEGSEVALVEALEWSTEEDVEEEDVEEDDETDEVSLECEASVSGHIVVTVCPLITVVTVNVVCGFECELAFLLACDVVEMVVDRSDSE